MWFFNLYIINKNVKVLIMYIELTTYAAKSHYSKRMKSRAKPSKISKTYVKIDLKLQ